MLATKPATLQKATEGFTAIVDEPTDNNLIDIRQLLVPIIMKTKCDEFTLTHNILGVILLSERYQQIYKKGAYIIPPIIALYDDTIDKDATKTEVHRVEGNHKAQRNERQLYKKANNACQSFIMAFVEKTWYKELEDPDTVYTKVAALKLLDHLIEFCSGLHTVDAVDISQVMKTLYKDAEGIPQFINAMEAEQRKYKRAKLVTNNEYLHAVALKSLLQSGEYETENREWSKIPEDEQTWAEWKKIFRAAYVAKRRSEAAREGEEKPFRGSALFGTTPVTQDKKKK